MFCGFFAKISKKLAKSLCICYNTTAHEYIKNWRYNMFEAFINSYESVMHFIAEFTVHTLELVGISIIIIGSIRAIIQAMSHIKKKDDKSVMIVLGRSLALALEFKMGAEIVNTVIIRDLRELGILAIVIALRAILAILIHWEIKNEKKDKEELLSLTASSASEKESKED